MKWVKRVGIAVGGLAGMVIVWAAAGALVYSPEYVERVLRSAQSEVGDYLDGFPLSPLSASQTPFIFLNNGDWNGQQVIPADWIRESTSLDSTTHNAEYYAHSFGPFIYDEGNGYYKYMWYGQLRDGQQADIAAEGDLGQIIYISPTNKVIIVRNGTGFGIPLGDWTKAFYQVAGNL